MPTRGIQTTQMDRASDWNSRVHHLKDGPTEAVKMQEWGRIGHLYRWIQRKIFVYNVTFGLYMLDWWEHYLFNTLVFLLLWFLCYNSYRFMLQCLRWVTVVLGFSRSFDQVLDV
eukprot:c18921_g1_i1 orf=832-1173(-)